ncbi:9351_t:CDS:2 [Funneliformis geosporum]|uniref:13131_t:CDS:1 n=1 Tax=Funneliformis geosporum TaxID=1117311 RepID=A0A9W4T3C6_9GLOM|nr:13131_t:CDS:2 [Funneliformis geosporum]CAI2191034.1 9351_t:CDS:2 [Funneliformis geosporum]
MPSANSLASSSSSEIGSGSSLLILLFDLDYIKDSVDKHVQSLLNSLCWPKSNNNIESEESDPISEEDNDAKKSANGILVPWDDTISRFFLL